MGVVQGRRTRSESAFVREYSQEGNQVKDEKKKKKEEERERECERL